MGGNYTFVLNEFFITSLNFICLISIPWCTVQNITGFQGCHIQCRWQDTDICNHVWYSPSPYKSKWTFSFLSELVLWLGINKLPVFWIIPLTIHWQHSWVWSNSTNAQNNHFQWYKPDRTPDFWVICVALLRWQREASLWKIAIVYPLCSHSNNSRYHCHLEEYILTSETLINDPLGEINIFRRVKYINHWCHGQSKFPSCCCGKYCKSLQGPQATFMAF